MSIHGENLLLISQEYPELIFQNDGYEYLSPEVMERNAKGVQRVNDIMRIVDTFFVSFTNFKVTSGYKMTIRYQKYYNDEPSFIGVSYVLLEHI